MNKIKNLEKMKKTIIEMNMKKMICFLKKKRKKRKMILVMNS